MNASPGPGTPATQCEHCRMCGHCDAGLPMACTCGPCSCEKPCDHPDCQAVPLSEDAIRQAAIALHDSVCGDPTCCGESSFSVFLSQARVTHAPVAAVPAAKEDPDA